MKARDTIIVCGLGRLGARLCEGILAKKLCSKLSLKQRTPGKLEAKALSFEGARTVYGAHVEIEEFHTAAVATASVAVIAIKDSYDPRNLLNEEEYPHWFPVDVRTVGFRRDLRHMLEVCHDLQEFRGVVVVLTNPVDIFTALVQAWLPHCQVVGFGIALDGVRLCSALQKRGYGIPHWYDTPLGGEHGGQMVPLRSCWDWKCPRTEKFQRVLAESLAESRQIGPRIVQGLGYTLEDCAAVFVEDISMLVRPNAQRTHLCATVSDGNSTIGRPHLLRYGGAGTKLEAHPLSIEEEQELGVIRARNAELIGRIRSHDEFRHQTDPSAVAGA